MTATSPYDALFAGMTDLPQGIRDAHGVPLRGTGVVDVERGRGFWPNLLAWLMHLPPARAECPVTIEVSKAGRRIRWLRRFGSHATCTYQIGCPEGIREFVGLGSVTFGLDWTGTHLRYRQTRLDLLGISLPARMTPRIEASVAEAYTGWQVAVEVRTAKGALICRYAGNIAADGRSNLAAPGAG